MMMVAKLARGEAAERPRHLVRRCALGVAAVVVLVCVVGVSCAVAAPETPVPWWGLSVSSRPSDLRATGGRDAVQELVVKATGGDVFVADLAAFEASHTTSGFADVKFDASVVQVREALERLFPARRVLVEEGEQHGPNVHSWKIVFPGQAVEKVFANSGLAGFFGGGEALLCEESGVSCTAEASVAVLAEGEAVPTKVVVEAQNLGDASSTETACVRARQAGAGDYLDPGCSEAAEPGQGEYEIVKTPVTVTDTLPAGLRAVSAEGIEGPASYHGRGPVSCVVAPSGEAVTCTYEATVPAYEQLEVLISVAVEAGARSGGLNRASVSGGGAVGTRTATHAIEVDGSERFGVESYTLVPEELGGAVDTQAGSHPFQVTGTIVADSGYENAEGKPRTVALVKDYDAKLPAGLIGNPTPFEQCTDAQFAAVHDINIGHFTYSVNDCPALSAVGVALVRFAGPGSVGNETALEPIFNMVPDPGEPARFGFLVKGLVPVFLDTAVRTGADYGVTVSSHDIVQSASLLSVKLTLWGMPGSRLHDAQRGYECLEGFGSCPVSTASSPPPFVIMPTSCERPFSSSLFADSWPAEGKPSEEAEASYGLEENGRPLKIDGCDRLPFEPAIEASPDVADASTSSGLTVNVHVPQTAALNPEGLAESSVKDITVVLPEGVQVNPAGGNGLEACAENLVGYLPGESHLPSELHFTPTLPEPGLLRPGVNFCPNASKIATVNIKTPLLPHELTGAVYLASQNQNPFGSLLALYLVAEDPVSGTIVKLPGRISLCQAGGEVIAGQTCGVAGQLVTTFEDSPELPFEDATLHFFGGERAPLATPAYCGTYQTTAAFLPWSAEQGDEANVTARSSSAFQIERGPNGTPCTYAGQSLPFAPSLAGGTTNVDAGSFSPLTTTIDRQDGEGNMQSVQLRFPPGLSGVLSGVKLCGEPQAGEGLCGPESLIGETTVTAGVGSDPAAVKGGRVYITGPYNGAPFGLSIVNPVKAGPIDLEHDTSRPAEYMPACDCVVVRAKVEVNPLTAALTVTTDASGPHAIPRLIDGIPVQIKAVDVTVDRPGFTFNPTSCNPMSITGAIASDEGASSPVAVPFQVTNCSILTFQPQFKVQTSASTSRTEGASLHVALTIPSGVQGTKANVKEVKVSLPKQLPSPLKTLQKACTEKVFAENPADCPVASRVGEVRVSTPVLEGSLSGPAYFVSHGGAKYPELIFVLTGEDGVTVQVHGETFISKQGITTATFATVPDVPFSSFELTLPKREYPALTANGNLCQAGAAGQLIMPTEMVAQNGDRITQSTKIAVTGCPKVKRAAKKKGTHPKKKTTRGKAQGKKSGRR